MSVRIAATLVGLLLGLELAPGSGASEPAHAVDIVADVPDGFIDRWSDQLRLSRERQDAVSSAGERVSAAAAQARAYLALPRDNATLDEAAHALHREDVDRGRALAERVLEVSQPNAIAARAHDIATYAAHRAGDAEGVVAHVERRRALTDHMPDGPGEDPLRGHRAFWYADALLRVGRPADAHDAAVIARGNAGVSPMFHEASMLVALAELADPETTRAGIRATERMLARYPEYPWRDRVTLDLARAEQRTGQLQAAADRVAAFVWDRPFSGRAAEARALLELLVLEGARVPTRTWSERLEHGRSLRLRRHWAVAEDELLAALAAAQAAGARLGDVNAIRLQLALNAYDSARFQTALDRMLEIESTGGYGVSPYNRATWTARSLSRLDREDEAYERLGAYYDQRSGSERLHRMHEFAFDLGRWDDALALLDARYTRARDWESWEGAFGTYLAGDFGRAADLFATLERRASGRTRARYGYWRARALEQDDRIAEAIPVYESVRDAEPYRYYGLQSVNRLAEWAAVGVTATEDAPPGLRPPAGPARIHWDGFGGTDSATWTDLPEALRHALLDGYPADAFDDAGAVAALSETWAWAFPELVTVQALYDIGAREPARKVFRDVVIEFRVYDSLAAQGRSFRETRPIRLSHRRWAHFIDNRSPELGYWGISLDEERFPVPNSGSARSDAARRQVAIAAGREELRPLVRAACRALGDYYMARRFALDDDIPSLASEPLDPRWFEAYPRAYGDELRPAVEAYDLNPMLLWALSIVESDMNPDTVSHAFAYGLLQVIPKTGDLVALGFGETDFGIYTLMEPADSVRYGAWYLNELLTKFHGQELLAMIAYNAGPHQVARWLQWRGEGMALDEFIETVPYDGARRYPQRIVQYLSILRAVNGLDRRVYIGNDLDVTVEENIYY